MHRAIRPIKFVQPIPFTLQPGHLEPELVNLGLHSPGLLVEGLGFIPKSRLFLGGEGAGRLGGFGRLVEAVWVGGLFH
jgi:hypothetical protein